MAFEIKDEPKVDLARWLSALTGEPITETVRIALRERLNRMEAGISGRPLRERLQEIAEHCAALPVRWRRAENEVLGYDNRGLLVRR